jgi:hypothetical protein
VYRLQTGANAHVQQFFSPGDPQSTGFPIRSEKDAGAKKTLPYSMSGTMFELVDNSKDENREITYENTEHFIT